MTVLVIGVRWPPETFIARRLGGLLKIGVNLIVATADRNPAPAIKGFQLICLPSWDRPAYKRMGTLITLLLKAMFRSPSGTFRDLLLAKRTAASALEFIRSLYRTLPFVGFRPDVVHFDWNFAAIEYLPLFDLMNSKFVISCRGSQIQVAPHNPARTALVPGLETTLRKADAVHCVSTAIKNEAVHFGLDENKAWVIRPAVDPKIFTPVRNRNIANSQMIRVVSTGSIIWPKGYEYALIAIRKLIDAGCLVQYDIIGAGPKTEVQRLMFCIDDMHLNNVVKVRGRLQPSDVLNVLQQADIFLLPSLSEGISNAVLEAMACELPVVTTECGGMREAVDHGIEGFVVPVRDTQAMAEALLKLARDPILRKRLGAAGRARILKDFSIDRQIESFRSLYQTISANDQGQPVTA